MPPTFGSTGSGRQPAIVTVAFTYGWLRLSRHILIALTGIGAAGLWFGSSGVIPMLIWGWHAAPRRGRQAAAILVDLRAIRLGRLMTTALDASGQRIEVFSDELPAAELAAYRRELKRCVSAGDGPEDVEPI